MHAATIDNTRERAICWAVSRKGAGAQGWGEVSRQVGHGDRHCLEDLPRRLSRRIAISVVLSLSKRQDVQHARHAKKSNIADLGSRDPFGKWCAISSHRKTSSRPSKCSTSAVQLSTQSPVLA